MFGSGEVVLGFVSSGVVFVLGCIVGTILSLQW
jgi:hypothetical protein